MSQPSNILDLQSQAEGFPFSKVPAVTALFWIIKVLTTGMGETTSDYLVRHFDPHLAVAAGFVCFLLAIGFKFAAPRYEAWIYWMAVVMVSVFGTMAADVIHVVLGVPYIASTTVFALSLALIFLMWQRSEGTLMSFSHDEALLSCVATSCVRIAVRRRPQHRLTGLGAAPGLNDGNAPRPRPFGCPSADPKSRRSLRERRSTRLVNIRPFHLNCDLDRLQTEAGPVPADPMKAAAHPPAT